MAYLARNIDTELLKWKESSRRKPLIPDFLIFRFRISALRQPINAKYKSGEDLQKGFHPTLFYGSSLLSILKPSV